MVNLGIERLQQLVQQPPLEYASTNRDKESAMAATDSEISAETRYRTRGCKKDRKGRRQRHRSRTPSTSPSWSPPRYRSRSRPRRSSSRKPDKRDISRHRNMRPPIATKRARWQQPTAKVQRRCDITQEVTRRTGRGAESGTAAARHQRHQVGPHQDTAADCGHKEAAAGSPTNGISAVRY